MTLTVRLTPTLESALQRYCLERGATKSLVVQESLAAYLLAAPPVPAAGSALAHSAASSAAFQALAELGLLGAFEGEGRSATKSVVRERAGTRRSPQAGKGRTP